MNKSVLLVLLWLQVFLHVTASPSADETALVSDHPEEKTPDLEGSTEQESGKLLVRTRRSCWRSPGGCRRKQSPNKNLDPPSLHHLLKKGPNKELDPSSLHPLLEKVPNKKLDLSSLHHLLEKAPQKKLD